MLDYIILYSRTCLLHRFTKQCTRKPTPSMSSSIHRWHCQSVSLAGAEIWSEIFWKLEWSLETYRRSMNEISYRSDDSKLLNESGLLHITVTMNRSWTFTISNLQPYFSNYKRRITIISQQDLNCVSRLTLCYISECYRRPWWNFTVIIFRYSYPPSVLHFCPAVFGQRTIYTLPRCQHFHWSWLCLSNWCIH